MNTTPRFGHDKLDAYRVAREALILGEAIAKGLPRGYGTLADQLRRRSMRCCSWRSRRRRRWSRWSGFWADFMRCSRDWRVRGDSGRCWEPGRRYAALRFTVFRSRARQAVHGEGG
jgi:hypothetical protein